MTNKREFYYRWSWNLEADAQQLWPLIANTNHFDKDAGLPSYDQPEQSSIAGLSNTRRRLQIRMYGVPLSWVEEPFEWIRPYRFGVTRNYEPGLLQPMKQLRVLAQLIPKPSGGTRLIYEVWVTPSNWLGHLAIPIQIGQIYARRFDATFRAYDKLAQQNKSFAAAQMPSGRVSLATGAPRRLPALRTALIDKNHAPELVDRLIELLTMGDDLTLNRIRPYVLANEWGHSRKEVLALMLQATRLGLLDFQWDLLCPMCRGAKESVGSLSDVTREVHCDTCNIDYRANFSRSVELTFRPNPAIRRVPQQVAYCSSGPEATPHIAVQQLLPPHAERIIMPQLEPGRYRLRAAGLSGNQLLEVHEEGQIETAVDINPNGWPQEAFTLIRQPTVLLTNNTSDEQLIFLERVAWADHAVTAAEVTTLQQFRDLFSEEALRPGDQISVGSLTILFTDLCDSTRMYREIGDAPAFGLVMNHFDVLRQAIEDEDGAIVKTIGDAVMAVFRRPVSALRAVMAVQSTLMQLNSKRPLRLKAAVHHGPSIAVTLNERLDYFGSSVNIAARLEKFSQGSDIIISEAVFADPEVQDYLQDGQSSLQTEAFASTLKGFDEESFMLYRIHMCPLQPAFPLELATLVG